MPFGLCNAPATFERMIDNVLRRSKWDICLCYLDDIVVYGSTFKEHLARLDEVLRCIQQAGLCLNYKKCHFATRQITILGHQFMLISKTKEDFKTPFLISSIGPKYFGILRNLVFPEEVDQVPFDKLCMILLKHFNPKTNIIYERFIFQKMDQKSAETISKYMIRLKEQAQRCNFGDFLQESLRDRFVAGIIDTSTQKKLLQEKN
ncbi:K02A2.6-like [Cordylochernes scorpioides]|uniref:K02A2.6-like n=1 Tax=Cordylochernes scorpioides TaxID=51811 RepID=A0ABY6LHW3_9ARAC|nr:K02A2.6-like [Cordylochernes scorpioides]